MVESVKPPLGLRPEMIFLYVSNIERIKEIEAAADRYFASDVPVPEIWWSELRERVAMHNEHRRAFNLKDEAPPC